MATPLATMTRRCSENGSSRLPAIAAATTMPATIMIHVTAAAAARRSGATPDANKASIEVPLAPTPMPISVKARIANAVAANASPSIIMVALTAIIAPSARAAIPPKIHGVRLLPRSEPWPHRGRLSWTA